MPMYHWNEVSAGNLAFVRKNPNVGGLGYAKDDNQWIKLYDEFINEFGHNERYMKIMKHRHNIAKLQCDYILDSKKNAFNKTLIRIEEANIVEIENGMRSGMTVHQANIYVSKFLGAGILNFKKVTVHEYHSALKEYVNHNKQQQKDGNKGRN